ncbi:MAG: hypothetical protein AAF039_07710 [Bacteroidota bacterium]
MSAVGSILNVKNRSSAFSVLSFIFLILSSFTVHSQKTSSVKAEIDTAQIKIGEQIQYKITVETDSLNLVHFPENQTFSPLEMVEALKVDTTKKKDRITLQRIYALTQFDSGTYVIPQQRIAINEDPFLTDSFRISVADVLVDTTKQKLYDIKPLVKVERSYAKVWKWLIAILLALLLIGGVLYWFFLRSKPLTDEEKVALLPPYDRALLQLKELENSRYLIQDEYKKYYSELTNIVRAYLEEEVHISAMESTTDQLIERLELLKDAGELKLEDETLNQFKKVLQTADLVKFAKSKPAISIAEDDRKSVEFVVVKTKEALPEPVEEELLQNEEYLAELERKRKRKRIWTAAAVLAGLIVLGVGTSMAVLGVQEVKDTILRHPTKRLLEGEWVSSSYGYPPIDIATPEVLVRKELDEFNPTDSIQSAQLFGITNYDGMFSASVSATTFSNGKPVDFQKSVEDVLRSMESKGAKNIIAKDEETYTKSGIQGLKTYGSYQMKVPESNKSVRTKYALFLFGGTGFQQQIILTWMDGDEYAEQIVQRITASIDVKTQA